MAWQSDSWYVYVMDGQQVAKLLQEEADDADEMADLADDIAFPIMIHCSGKLDVPPIKVSDVSFGYPGMKKPLFTHAEVPSICC